ncbi:mycothiol synthase [Mobilicoccus massiliensis]|uniref:mycothiol synthase n=1 Tax=Mobilicoccus massiliensis TaxID=1522310 RepID=UPI000590A731|nr:mycothiol synthase [Mobilicoccus massiliensis]
MDPVIARVTTTLSTAEATRVRRLARQAAEADGVDALSEQTILHLDAPAGEHRHVLLERGDHGASGAEEDNDDPLLGYAHLDHTEAEAGTEIVVAPGHRRHGVGTRGWREVRALVPDARVWAHGDLPPARAFARHLGLEVVRELIRMARPLDGLRDAEVTLPEGYSARTFTPDDVDAWVALNARAFADHPEQGRVSADDLRARMREPWFDADGFFLVEAPAAPDDGASRDLAAFHWTKTEDGEGEVYVVGVDPDRQGLGLGKAATLLGLRHLADRGLARVTLYVDGNNTAALATYRRLGFEQISLDVMYA